MSSKDRPLTFGEGHGCPPPIVLLRFAEDPASVNDEVLSGFDDHLARCSACRDKLEVASRRLRRRLGSLVRDERPARAIPGASGSVPIILRPAVWPVAAAVLVCVGVVAVMGMNVSQLSATAARLKTENAQKDSVIHEKDATIRTQQNTIHDLEEREKRLKAEIDASGLAQPVLPRDPKEAITVVGPNRNQLQVAGTLNPIFIQEARVSFGTDPGGPVFKTIYRGPERRDPDSKPVSFKEVSPELRLSGQAIVATIEFVPYKEVAALFPEYYTPDRMQYSRTFILARDGIQADVDLVAIRSPTGGAKVQEVDEVDGRLSSGWPVVFVMPLSGDRRWWVQDPVTEVADGQFSLGTVHFGNDKTKSGEKFKLIVVAARSRDEALKFKAGEKLDSLPIGLPRSQLVTVIRE